ncbi:MAG: hypothetical protein IH899_19705, partial [Planctomycetes bacterium]|nr:hypothetical protein [Planctomycetota bacterium]
MPGINETKDRKEILAVLGRLRSKIRGYVLAEGTALVLIVLGSLFWLSLGLDWFCFWVSRLELPKAVRIVFDLLALILVSAGCVLWIVQRFAHVMRPKALALVLERRFPHLDDRLITSVEIEESTTGRESALTESMLRRTVDDVTQAAEGLDVGDVFDKLPLRRAILGAAALMISITGFYWVMPEAMGYWWAAYVKLEDEYWDRRTEILVHVETRPNNQKKDFRDREGLPTNGRPGDYKHRIGDDLVLFIEVPQKVSRGKFQGEDAVVPEYVTVSYDFTGVRDSDDADIRIRPGTRHVKFTLSAVTENVEIFVSGGDFTNRLPYRIVVVDAPRLDEIVLKSDFPEYTGLNRNSQSSGLQDKKVQGLQTTIPAETRFLFHCQVNKPLVNVRLDFGPHELVFGDFLNSPNDSSGRKLSFKAELTTRSLDGGPAEVTDLLSDKAGRYLAGRYLAGDRMSFTVPFVASRGKTEAARQRREQSFPTYGKPFVLDEDYEMRIYLEDADGIRTVDPTKLMIIAIPDSPPEFIDVEVQGVDTMITHRADIPVRGIIADDYGIAMSRFEFQIDDETESWIPRPFDNPPEEYPKEFKLQRGPKQEFERFSVLPLDLQVGQKLTLTLFAEDDDNLNGPNSGRSKRFTFTIVSPADLLINMYEKELNLKKRFEQIR